MTVQKNSQSINDFADLGDLIKTHQETQSTNGKDTSMTESKKTTGVSNEAKQTPAEQILSKAKAEGFDITQPHPLVGEFASALNPYGDDLPEEGSRWVLALASGDPENPMTVDEFILESYKDPTRFVMSLANKQGEKNVYAINKVREMLDQMNLVIKENTRLRADVNRLNAELRQRTEEVNRLAAKPQERTAPTASEDFANLVEESLEHLKAEVVNDISEAQAEPIKVIGQRPTKPEKVLAPNAGKLVTVRVEEPDFWGSAAKAVAIGVISGAAAYGTIRALDYFFGDSEE